MCDKRGRQLTFPVTIWAILHSLGLQRILIWGQTFHWRQRLWYLKWSDSQRRPELERTVVDLHHDHQWKCRVLCEQCRQRHSHLIIKILILKKHHDKFQIHVIIKVSSCTIFRRTKATTRSRLPTQSSTNKITKYITSQAEPYSGPGHQSNRNTVAQAAYFKG